MRLTIETEVEIHRIEDYGLNSAVGAATQGFWMGGGITSCVSSGKFYAVGTVSAGVSFSFSSPKVVFVVRPGLRSALWRANLPHVG